MIMRTCGRYFVMISIMWTCGLHLTCIKKITNKYKEIIISTRRLMHLSSPKFDIVWLKYDNWKSRFFHTESGYDPYHQPPPLPPSPPHRQCPSGWCWFCPFPTNKIVLICDINGQSTKDVHWHPRAPELCIWTQIFNFTVAFNQFGECTRMIKWLERWDKNWHNHP